MTSPRWAAYLLVMLLAGAGGGCRRAREALPPPPPAPPAAAPASDGRLPEVAGFAAGPLTRGAGYVRRSYARGRALIDVTLAQMAISPDDYDRWVAASASFPQATLDLPAGQANGFYQCTGGPPESCDLLIQLRAGVHVELRSGGTATRDDVDALARALPLRALAAPPAR
jgi:hypothetical protein